MAIQLSGSLSVLGGIETTGSVGFSYPEITGPKAWSAGGALSTARYGLGGAGKTVGSAREGNSAITFGGRSALSNNVTCTEEYNYGIWSEGGALITGRCRLAGAGEVNAALAIGGHSSPSALTCTEEYNGTTWSAGGPLSNTMCEHAAAGTQNAGLAFDSSTQCTEEYNGSTWSPGGALINSGTDGIAGMGYQDAALAVISFNATPAGSSTEEYDGSNWSSGGQLSSGCKRRYVAGAGIQNAALLFGGDGSNSNCTEEYDGSSWTAGNALITGRRFLAGAGTQTAGLAIGGGITVSPFMLACTEEYAYPTQDTTTFNFSSTTGDIIATGSFTGSFGGAISGHIIPDTNEVYDLGSSTNRFRDLYLSGSTIYLGDHSITETSYAEISGSVSGKTLISSSEQINALGVTASVATTATTSSYVAASNVDGTVTNATTASIATTATTASYAVTASYALNGGGGGGGAAFPHTGSAIISGSLAVTGSVEFAYSNTIAASWSAGGALINSNSQGGGAGTQDSALYFGGGSNSACTEEYDGSSWSAGGALITGRYQLTGAGTQAAGLAIGGGVFPGFGVTLQSATEEYNGSSWSAGGALITARRLLAGAGTQNAGLVMGGANSGTFICSCTEEYDGTSWATGGALITARRSLAGAGTQNAGLASGGDTAPSAQSCTEEYDGTSWSAGGALITARGALAGAGEQNAGLAFGGQSPSTVSCTEEYDGSSWTAGGAMILGRYSLAGAGTKAAGLAIAGFPSSTSTEEYTGASSSLVTSFDYSSTTGETTVSCLIETSAERYKDNIQPMESQLNKVMQLQPVEFDWKSNKKHDIGFVADSVKNVYPNLVSEKDGQVEGMNYSKLVSALVKSIQEQQTQIDELKARLDNNN